MYLYMFYVLAFLVRLQTKREFGKDCERKESSRGGGQGRGRKRRGWEGREEKRGGKERKARKVRRIL